MNWQRARTDENKNERKEEICQAAITLFTKNGYENVSLNGIASEARFTKSNIYRYFSSREEIFLNIFSKLFEKWVEDCCKQLEEVSETDGSEKFADVWVNSLIAHPQFLDLTPILFVSLEKNSSFEQLFEFKKLSKWLLYRISTEVSRIYPEFNEEKAFKFLTLSHAATSSYWALNSQNDVLREIYQNDEFKEMKPNFKKDLKAAIIIFIQGLKAT